MSFEVGDDVVVILTDHYRIRRIVRRHLVEKVHKTGHVIVNGGEKYRQDGSCVLDRAARFKLHRWTPELQAESDETNRRTDVERKFYRFVDAARRGRDFEVIDKVMKLIPQDVFDVLEVK
jgi:hypothetical protein